MSQAVEYRNAVEPPEFRSRKGKLVATGVAIRYGARSKPIDGQFVEEIRSGATARTLRETDVMALHENNPLQLLGRTGAGTLRLTDSRSELAYEIDLPATTVGRDVAYLIERGDVKGTSFGFRAMPGSVRWSVGRSGMALRSIGEIRLDHISTTYAPAYDEPTAVSVAYRSLADERGLDLATLMAAGERGELGRLLSQRVPQGYAFLRAWARAETGSKRPGTHIRRPAHWFV